MFCLSFAFIQNFSMESSLVSLLQMSALHAWVLRNHNKPPLRAACLMMMVTWILSTLLTSVPLWLADHTESGLCTIHTFTEDIYSIFVYSIVLHLAINPAVLVISSVFTVQSVLTIYKSDLRVRKFSTGSGPKSKSMLVLLSHMACRCLCWAPLQMSLLVRLSGGNVSSDTVTYMMLMGFSLNLLINPLLYTLRTFGRTQKKK